jgi:hypothetical protein
MSLTEVKGINTQKKKAIMGIRHILLYREKNDELKDNYRINIDGLDESVNKKDKDFIFF